jgi:sodium transport system ATP-binding protein
MLSYFAELYGLGPKEAKIRIDELVERLRISEFADRLCDKLSTGQKQKVSIARSIIHDPSVIIFDEPTTGLDVVTSQLILEFIEDCKAKGKTVILSTHIMSECERLCDRISIIDKGKIMATGTIPELLTQTGQSNFEKAYLSIIGYDSAAGVAL